MGPLSAGALLLMIMLNNAESQEYLFLKSYLTTPIRYQR